MGIYVNPGNVFYTEAVNTGIYVDKSGLISYTNACISTMRKNLCISRPRRFGKSMAADMLTAYYSRGCDSRSLFSGRKVEAEASFGLHLNRHNVIRLDVQRFLRSEEEIPGFIPEIEGKVTAELLKEFPECGGFGMGSRLADALDQIFIQTGKGFIFIVDEWDCVFRMAQGEKEAQKRYLDFLRGLFKGAGYVELVYMTGILPIKKYGEHSAINIFDEYSMTDPRELWEYYGFTEKEVITECRKHGVNYGEMERWYDGYLLGGQHIYNPKSVADALTWKEFQSYWTGTETYEALKVYIDRNFDGLKEAVIEMLGGGRCRINARKFQNDMTTFTSRDDVLALLVHLGYLTYDKRTGEAFIPTLEIMQEFLNAVDGAGWCDGCAEPLGGVVESYLGVGRGGSSAGDGGHSQ